MNNQGNNSSGESGSNKRPRVVNFEVSNLQELS